MGVFTNVLSVLTSGASRNIGVQNSAPDYYADAAAVTVTQSTAMQVSAVYACVKILTETIGSLPINVYKLSDGGVETPYPEHPLSMLFRHKPNKHQTRQEYIESLVWQFLMQGNDYTRVLRDSKGQLVSLMPMMVGQMQVELQENSDVWYKYQMHGGQVTYKEKGDIWHNKLYGNGIIGLSPLAHARNTVGVAQAADLSTTKIYQNGGKPSGLLKYDKFLTDEQRAKAKTNFSEISSGTADRLFVLEGGMDWESVSLSPSDIELLASRQYQIQEICRFWGVPSILVNDTNVSTTLGSGIGEIIQAFYKFSLRPYLSRYESSMQSNLLNNYERDTMRIRFDLNALLRPDLNDRMKSYGEGIQKGVMTPNEARIKEGWKPIEGGDKLYMQHQMVPMDMLDKIQRGKTDESVSKDKE